MQSKFINFLLICAKLSLMVAMNKITKNPGFITMGEKLAVLRHHYSILNWELCSYSDMNSLLVACQCAKTTHIKIVSTNSVWSES